MISQDQVLTEKQKLMFSHPTKVLQHVKQTATEGNVSSVIAAMDHYGYRNEQLISVGDKKGEILDSLVREANPRVALELGTYCAYSALRIGSQLNSEAKLYTIELYKDVADAAKEIIKYAGMDKKITVLNGATKEIIPTLSEKLGISAFDFVFIDHWKDLYKPDLISLESYKLIKEGSVIVADNVVFPGSPDYLEYVRNNPKYECTNYPSMLEYSDDQEDALEKSVYKG